MSINKPKLDALIKNITDATSITQVFDKPQTRKVVYFEKGKFLAISRSADQDWLKVKKYLREKSKEWNVHFTDKLIDDSITTLIFELKRDGKKLQQLGKTTNDWLTKLKKTNIAEYVFVRPIHYLLLKREINLGKVKLVKLSKRITDNLIKSSSRKGNPLYENMVSDMIKNNQTNVFGIITVKSTEPELADKISQQYLERALNSIRIFYHNIPIIQGEELVRLSHHDIVSIKNKESIGYDMSNVNLKTPYLLDSKKYRNNMIWKILVSFLFSEKPSSIQERILVALDWYGEAFKDRTIYSAFLKYITALEILLVFDTDYDKSEKIANRLSSILYPKSTNKQEVYELIKNYYKIRNGITHAGKRIIYPEDLNQVRIWTQYLFQIYIQKSIKYSDVPTMLQSDFSIQI